jgi:predicted PolB exonuclease-like 3'-5' exonuclease
MPKFVEFMLNFDGYIIWFNSLAFDNPVSLHHALKDNFDEAEYHEKLAIVE